MNYQYQSLKAHSQHASIQADQQARTHSTHTHTIGYERCAVTHENNFAV